MDFFQVSFQPERSGELEPRGEEGTRGARACCTACGCGPPLPGRSLLDLVHWTKSRLAAPSLTVPDNACGVSRMTAEREANFSAWRPGSAVPGLNAPSEQDEAWVPGL